MTRQEAEAIAELRHLVSGLVHKIESLETKVDSMAPQVEIIRKTVTAVTIGKRVLWWLGGMAITIIMMWDWLAVRFAWVPQLGRNIK